MAYHNNTPASILTAPSSEPRPVVSHTYEKDEDHDTVTRVTKVAANQGDVDTVTGVYTNPARKVRKAKAAAKRVRRNKKMKGSK